MTPNNIFLTGATGNIGANLMLRILDDDPACRVFPLVRANSTLEAEQRVLDAIQIVTPDTDIESVRKRITVLCGNVSQHNLGLADSTRNDLSTKITHIIHSAGATQFNLSLGQALLTNYTGTRNVMTFAKLVHGKGRLQRVAHVSTAYICGTLEGTIYEDELPNVARFLNNYEWSKWETERYLRNLMGVLPLTIFRPSVVIGDSRTGRLIKFNVLYPPLKFILHGHIKALRCSPDTPLDVVPVDFVCDAIHHIFFKSERSVGKTFHIVAGKGKAATVGEIVNHAIDFFNERFLGASATAIRYLPKTCRDLDSPEPDGTGQRTNRAMTMFEDYLHWDRHFDDANTTEALRGSGIEAPRLASYYNAILSRYFDSGTIKLRKCAA